MTEDEMLDYCRRRFTPERQVRVALMWREWRAYRALMEGTQTSGAATWTADTVVSTSDHPEPIDVDGEASRTQSIHEETTKVVVRLTKSSHAYLRATCAASNLSMTALIQAFVDLVALVPGCSTGPAEAASERVLSIVTDQSRSIDSLRRVRRSVQAALVDGHEILPVGGHVGADWRSVELPVGGQVFCPS